VPARKTANRNKAKTGHVVLIAVHANGFVVVVVVVVVVVDAVPF